LKLRLPFRFSPRLLICRFSAAFDWLLFMPPPRRHAGWLLIFHADSATLELISQILRLFIGFSRFLRFRYFSVSLYYCHILLAPLPLPD